MRRELGTAGTIYLALVSVVLAWAVWFITRQEVRDEEVFTITVEAVVEEAPLLSARVIRDTAEVELTIAGPKGDVAAVRASGDRAAVVYIGEGDIPPEDYESTKKFELRDLHFGPLERFESTQAVKMVPDKVWVSVTRYAEIDAIVLPPALPKEEEHEGYRLDVRHVPPSARVRGPASQLRLSELATKLDEDQLARAIERMEDDPQQTVYVDLIPIAKDGTVYGEGVTLMEEIVATVEINHLATLHRWVDLAIVVSRSAGVTPDAFRFSSVNRTNFGQVGGEDAWVPGRDGAPTRANLAFRGAPKKLSLLPEAGLQGVVWADGLVGTDGNPTAGRATLHMLRLPAGVTLERSYEVDIDVAR